MAKLCALDNVVEEQFIHKIYIEPHQIILTDGEILVNFNGDLYHVEQLNCDVNGLWVWQGEESGGPKDAQWVLPRQPLVEKDKNACMNGHRIWCQRCKGCNVRYCLVGRCKCMAWE